MAKQSTKPLTVSEVARYFNVSNTAVINWIKGGRLSAWKTPGGRNRVSVEEFRRFLEELGVPIVEEFFRNRR